MCSPNLTGNSVGEMMNTPNTVRGIDVRYIVANHETVKKCVN